ncbi:MAG: carbohydrate binding family 9 domain-containing protein, partial [Opitutaceae bacterium]
MRVMLALTLAAVGTAMADQPETSPAPAPNGKRAKRIYATVRLQGKQPVVDGKLDDACWREQGRWMGGYRTLVPNYDAKPTRETEIKILYDDRNVYVAIRAFEADVKGVARVSGDRDEFVGDIVGVCFDSYHDKRSGFEFDLTAAGQKIDVKLFNFSWDPTFNAVWEGKTGSEPDAWTAEFLIPLSQLRYNPEDTTWGLHSWRWIDRLKEESDWNLL